MSSDDDTTEPTELDPGMVEKARAAFEAMTKAALDSWRRYEERMNAAITAALSASELGAEVERLREALLDAELNVTGEANRATSAEQERDRLRAGIEALAQQVEWNERNGAGIPPIQARHLRALLAGSGEQPAPTALVRVEWGVVLDDLGSTDVYETIRAFIEEEVGFDGGPGMDDQARRLTDAVLAVVGQGVTAEQAWDEGATKASPHGGAYLRSILIQNPYRAAVRPTGQEQADG